MSQRAVERVLGKLVTDESFREAFFRSPERAALQAGVELTAEEIEALVHVPRPALASLAASVDNRIRRLCIENAWPTEESAR